MKATILVTFRDRYDRRVVYAPGDVREFNNDRAAALAARGLVEPLAEVTREAEENPETDISPAKSKGRGEGKSPKKDKEAAVAASGSENVETDTGSEADVADADNPCDKEQLL